MKPGMRYLLRGTAIAAGAFLTFKLVDLGERVYANGQLAKGARRRAADKADQTTNTR